MIRRRQENQAMNYRDLSRYVSDVSIVLDMLRDDPKLTVTYGKLASLIGMRDATGGVWQRRMIRDISTVLYAAAALDREVGGTADADGLWDRFTNEKGETGKGLFKRARIVRSDA
jgi:hypothetical protein